MIAFTQHCRGSKGLGIPKDKFVQSILSECAAHASDMKYRPFLATDLNLFHLHIFQIVYFLVHINVDAVSSLLALFVSRKVAQMTTEMIKCYHLR